MATPGAAPNATASARLSSSAPMRHRSGSLPNRRANRPSNVSAMTASAIAVPAPDARPGAAAAIAATPPTSDTYVSRLRRSNASTGDRIAEHLEEPLPCADGARQERLRLDAVDERVDGQPIDQQLAERCGERGAPGAGVHIRARPLAEPDPVAVDPSLHARARRAGWAHEAEELGEVARRRANGGVLLVERAHLPARSVSPEAHVARIAVVVDQCDRHPLGHRTP